MTLKSISLALAFVALPALTLPAIAQDRSGTNLDPAATGTPESGVRTMALAQDLYQLGLAQTDALTVLAAARLAASVVTEQQSPADLDLTPDELASFASRNKPPLPNARTVSDAPTVSLARTGTGASDADDGSANAPATADAMLTKARDLARDDPATLGLIDGAAAEGQGGGTNRAVTWLSHLPAGQTDIWEVPVQGTSHAEIAVIGDGDSNLDVSITDGNGNVFCHDVSWSDALYCDFTPAWDGYFYVTVQNMGAAQNSYHLVTN
jgi:hypothetical protein